jgi:glycosyltransferase involved in cell wall biosynthesis
MSKISIIIPIYNAEKYLEQCLDSVVNQTLKDIEIICINDGSTDNSVIIIEKFLHKNKQLKIINKKNGGYGSACNAGLASADGEYIAIVEPDDFVKLDMYEKLYYQAKELNVDIVKSSFWMYFDDENGDEWMNKIRWTKDIKPPSKVFNIVDYPVFFYHHPSIWSAIYKKSFLDEKHICFNEVKGAGWVDNLFNMKVLIQAKNISWIPQAYYYYRQTNADASSNLKDYNIPINRVTEMFDFIEQYPEKYKKIAEYFMLRILAYVDICLRTAIVYEKGREFEIVKNKILNVINRIPKYYISDNPAEFQPFTGRLSEFKNISTEKYLENRMEDAKKYNQSRNKM